MFINLGKLSEKFDKNTVTGLLISFSRKIAVSKDGASSLFPFLGHLQPSVFCKRAFASLRNVIKEIILGNQCLLLVQFKNNLILVVVIMNEIDEV